MLPTHHCLTTFALGVLLLAPLPAQYYGQQDYAQMLSQAGIDPNAVYQHQARQNAQMVQMIEAQRQALPIVGRRPGNTPGMERVDFGNFTIEIPQGWSADAMIGSPTSLAHLVRATSPDGRHQMLFASDWYAIYDTQTGGYLPGNAVMEGHILPAYAQQIAPYRIESIVARTPNTRVNDPMAQSFGMQMPRDSGSMTFTVRTPQGELLWGEAFAETLRTADDTMGIGLGVYTVPLCSIVVSPADQSTLSQAGATLRQMRNSMQLDGRNSQAWLQASRSASQASHSANMAAINGARERSQMTFQTYNEISDMQMDSWQRMQESGDRLQQIQTNTIRGGEYMTNPETGQEYWTTHEVDNWYVNSGGAVVGTEIQEVPTYDDSWTQLESQVPEPSY